MTPLDVKLDGDNCWPELQESGFVPAQIIGIARLPVATSGGRSAVVVRIQLEDGRTVLAQTTLRLMSTAMKAIEIREEMERDKHGNHH